MKKGDEVRRRGRGNFPRLNSWRKWRRSVFRRDDYRCVLCRDWRRLIAPHHILPKRDFPKLKYAVSNGITLCFTCHKKTFGKEYKFVKRIVNKLFGGLNKWRLIKHYKKRKMLKNLNVGSKKR